MPDFVLPIGCALVIAAAIILLPFWFRHRTEMLQQALSDAEVAQESARRLIKDETVDVVLFPTIFLFASSAGKSWISRRFVYDLLTGRVERISSATPSGHRDALRAAFDKLKEDHRSLFGSCVNRALLSSASADPFFGSLTRRFLGFSLDRIDHRPTSHPGRAESIALDLSPKTERSEPIYA